MKNTENVHHIGKVILWSWSYGFIQMENGESIFFHKSGISDEYKKNVKLLDEVRFEIAAVASEKHKGKAIAINVTFFSNGNLSEYQRIIGKLAGWKGKSGFIESPQLEKKVNLNFTRVLYNEGKLQNDDYLIFNPTKSPKGGTSLFALFAYSLEKEKDIDFLYQQYLDSQQPQIKQHILNLLAQDKEIPVSKKFGIELKILGQVSTQKEYLSLVQLLKEYKQNFNFTPQYGLLAYTCLEKYLIQLWEAQLIDSYDLGLMKNYFHLTGAENKRAIINRFNANDKREILLYHFQKLKEEGKANKPHNTLKTLLDIACRQQSTRHKEVCSEIKEYLLAQLSPKEIISLWMDGYIDNITESSIINNLNIDEIHTTGNLMKKQGGRFAQTLEKIYENYFLSTSTEDFEQIYPQLIMRLLAFEKLSPSRYKELLPALSTFFDSYQKFVLWIFGIDIGFNAKEYFKLNHLSINPFFKVKFFVHKEIINDNKEIKELSSKTAITQEGLEKWALDYTWNNFIYPTKVVSGESIYGCYFLEDIKEFKKNYDRRDIDEKEIAIKIYHALEKYEVHHLRLWLYEGEDWMYDYVGFRENFHNLTSEEQKLFKEKGDNVKYHNNVFVHEISEVIPCTNIIADNTDSTTYQAFLENIYFGKKYFKLRKEDTYYTHEADAPCASSGFNRILRSNSLNRIKFDIIVSKQDDRILNPEVLNEFFTLIHSGEIEKALGKVVQPQGTFSSENQAYTEDWNLRKQIIDYLISTQPPSIEPLFIFEPKNYYRRLDESSGYDSVELVNLFSIETSDGYGIVWENLDLTKDRATYIFKTKKENHQPQLEKIANAIVSFAQFRSALLSDQQSDELDIFKRNFGYVTSIRKRRGKTEAFSNWKHKLDIALTYSTPELPSSEEIGGIIDWSPQIPHSPSINKSNSTKRNKVKVRTIREEELRVVDLDIRNEINVKSDSNISGSDLRRKQQVLKALQTFNNSFLKNFDI